VRLRTRARTETAERNTRDEAAILAAGALAIAFALLGIGF